MNAIKFWLSQACTSLTAEEQNTIRYALVIFGLSYLFMFFWLEATPNYWVGQLIGPTIFIGAYFFLGVCVSRVIRYLLHINNKLFLSSVIFAPPLIRMLNPPLGALGSVIVFFSLYFIVGYLILIYFRFIRGKNSSPQRGLVYILSPLFLGIIFFLGYHIKQEFEQTQSVVLEDSGNDFNIYDIGLLNKGPHQVKTFTYGSGNDKHRQEYSAKADIITDSVDGSLLLDNWDGIRRWLRNIYWGFDSARLPIQARVWMPQKAGSYPLLLMVHGNHQMEAFSEEGFEYLGDFLASKGYIFVSIDQNFLNGSNSEGLYSIAWRLNGEIDARAWLILKHLEVWRAWGKDSNHLTSSADLSNIILLGHSRGGEAATIAASFNLLPHYPDNSELSFDFNFDIKGVISLAPSDGQDSHRSSLISTPDINYLTVQGSMDDDASSFMGLSVYNRTDFSRSNFLFKSSVFIYRANHNQFNSSWGRCDGQKFICWTNKEGKIISGEKQRAITKLLALTFSDVVTKNQIELLKFFQNSQNLSQQFPNTKYIINYADSNQHKIASFEEDADLATFGYGNSDGENLKVWKEKWLQLRWAPLESHVLELGWDRREIGSNPSYVLKFNTPILGYECIGFSAANFDSEARGKLIDFSVQLTYDKGGKSRYSLSDYSMLYPQFSNDPRINQLFSNTSFSEPAMQFFYFPLNQESMDTGLIELRLIFDKTTSGHIYMDDFFVGGCEGYL